MATSETKDLIIIGGGPAGLTAGIYAQRAKLKTLLIEKFAPGGLTASTDKIENYPGFTQISGIELMQKIETQAKELGLEIVIEEVISIDSVGTPHCVSLPKIVCTSNNEYKSSAIIIATGTYPKKLNIPGEEKFIGRGVSYCATCDGPFFRDKNIAVIGCGNSGIQEGLFLLKFVKHITFVEFLPYITADKILQERIQKEDRVNILLGHKLLGINGEQDISSITVQSRGTGEEKNIEVAGVFIYAGLIPNTQFLKFTDNGQRTADDRMRTIVALDKNGYIITNEKLETSIPGIFAAGDVRTKAMRQVITSAADGAIASFMVEKFLS